MKKILAIHGDVTLVQGTSIPEGAKQKKWNKGFVLERGEGVHTHTIESECEIYEKDGVMYLKSDKPITIDHEEHGVEVLQPGIYRKEMEQVFDYEDMEARQVVD